MNGRNEDGLAELLRSALAGDERCYAAFLTQVAIIVRGFVRARNAQGVDCEDVVQETLLAIHLKRHTWMIDAPVLPWVFAIARHKLIDGRRRSGRLRETALEGIAETLAAPEPEKLWERDIARALALLTKSQQQVVAAISLEGRSIAETARRLGKSETAIRVTLHRGLSAIARRFGRR